MKKRLLLLSVIMTLTSCSWFEDSLPPVSARIEACIGGASTKVLLAEGHSVWKKGDNLSVFYGSAVNECWRFEGEDGATSGVIVGGVR